MMIITDTYKGPDRRKSNRALRDEIAAFGIVFRDDVEIRPIRKGWFVCPEEQERRREVA